MEGVEIKMGIEVVDTQFTHARVQNRSGGKGAVFHRCQFTRCWFEGSFAGAVFVDCCFDGCRFEAIDLQNTQWINCWFINNNGWGYAELRGARFVNCSPLAQLAPMPDLMERLKGCDIRMDEWHSECGTKHCIAGWITTLHPDGPTLERLWGISTAAAVILASQGITVPDFYDHGGDDEDTTEKANQRAKNWVLTGEQK